jgi:DNA-binding LytR/AlgR family response regulator
VNLEHYLNTRRYYEIAFWPIFLAIIFVSDLAVIYFDIARRNLSIELWEPAVWEASSLLMVLVLIPVILRFDSLFPIRYSQIRRAIIAHIGFSLVFSLAHVGGMVALRHLAYAMAGSDYSFGEFLPEFLYEYTKDFRSYAIILCIIYLYRFILLRLQGEASLPSESDEPMEEPACPERLLVKKFGKEFLVKVREIERIEAAGNYVNLHVNGRVYPLRDTMNNIESKLAPAGLVRVHRSHIVSLDHIAEITTEDSGDGKILLKSELIELPLSRTYRGSLKTIS